MRKLLSILLTVLVITVLVHLMLDPIVRQMLYPAPPIPVPSPPSPLEEVIFELPGGERAVAWARAHPDPTGPAVLFLHGNGENLETVRMSGLFEQFAELGAHVLAVDYPGYGRSTGEPSEASLTAAGEAGLAWLGERHPDSKRVVVGWSLGAAVAIQVAARQPDALDALVLMSAWSDLASLAAIHFPSWLVSMGLKDGYDSVAAARDLSVPVLMIHGDADQIIPVTQGQSLHEALGPKSQWIEVSGAGHNDLLSRREVWQGLATVLQSTRP